jgi:hypothetical protein
MNTISFVNKGIVDLFALTTMGVNVKESDSAIGYFGTGFKYAVALLLRTNHEVEIYADGKLHKFSLQPQISRGKSFDIVCLDNQPLGFTTELGKNWQMWMAYRELYCNTIDENGMVFDGFQICPPNHTAIVVRGNKFSDEHKKRAHFILSEKKLNLIYSTPTLEVYDAPSEALFFKGIKVADVPSTRRYTYNLLDGITLTEDRTISSEWDFNRKVTIEIAKTENEAFAREFFFTKPPFWEFDTDFYGNASEVVADLVSDAILSFKPGLIKGARSLVSTRLRDALFQAPKYELSVVEQKQLSKAIAFLKNLRYAVDEYEIVVLENLGENVLGRAHQGKIYIATRVFAQGTKQVASTILEEYFHLKHNYEDETYHFQTFLFDQIIGMGETILGEPI